VIGREAARAAIESQRKTRNFFIWNDLFEGTGHLPGRGTLI
jgi:hypothetical protein